MSDIMGTIKITEDRIITKKEGLEEIWTRWGNGDEGKFIVYSGIRYKLLKTKEKEKKN
jgi:hypothetical protein